MNHVATDMYDERTLTLTQPQFEALLVLVQLGHWMANGIHIEKDRLPDYDYVLQYFFSLAPQFGMENNIVYDEEQKKYLPTEEYEYSSGIEEIKKRYDEEMFWAELAERFANRDAAQEIGEDALLSVDKKYWITLRSNYLQKYIQEFDKNGIKNIFVKGNT